MTDTSRRLFAFIVVTTGIMFLCGEYLHAHAICPDHECYATDIIYH